MKYGRGRDREKCLGQLVRKRRLRVVTRRLFVRLVRARIDCALSSRATCPRFPDRLRTKRLALANRPAEPPSAKKSRCLRQRRKRSCRAAGGQRELSGLAARQFPS